MDLQVALRQGDRIVSSALKAKDYAKQGNGQLAVRELGRVSDQGQACKEAFSTIKELISSELLPKVQEDLLRCQREKSGHETKLKELNKQIQNYKTEIMVTQCKIRNCKRSVENKEREQQRANNRIRRLEEELRRVRAQKEERDEHWRKYRWVPVYNLVLLITVLIEDLEGKIKDMQRNIDRAEDEKRRAARGKEDAERSLENTERALQTVMHERTQVEEEVTGCENEIDRLHELVGRYRAAVSDVMICDRSVAEILVYTTTACDKTESAIGQLSGKVDDARFMQASGTLKRIEQLEGAWRDVKKLVAENSERFRKMKAITSGGEDAAWIERLSEGIHQSFGWGRDKCRIL